MPLPIKTLTERESLFNKVVTLEDIRKNLPQYRRALSFFRDYPDIYVDFLVEASGPDCTFRLYPYQRVMLRALARHQDANLTFSRGTSKTFINVLWQMIKCDLYPNTKAAICSSTKGQSAKILEQKVQEILALIPAFKFELKKENIKVKDDVTVLFKAGSWIMNVAAKGSTRGDRYFGGIAA
ncbi:hypothetical protein [Massilibacteroides sp.]|uniref:hypothetical protein n=1 Tax=Massilibacteroides sp. TaxID=2034766 RepID=UPI0026300CF5|nr:hypothetical protein [Massilibacteroides sp.]MDD4516796.1 hypothetical protein [Massilibacteroides sp.]